MSNDSVLGRYRRDIRQKRMFLLVLTLLMLGMPVIAVSVGSASLSLADVGAVLLGGGTAVHRSIIWNIRLPRVFAAILAGAGLAVAGGAMQVILRNPLGSPFTLGISQAAAFGAALTIAVLGVGVGAFKGAALTTVTAFLSALVSAAVILLLMIYRRATPETMILAGVAIGSLFTAGVTAIQFFADDTEVAAIVFWTFGDVGRASWSNVLLMGVVVGPALYYFIRRSWEYNALDSGTKTAKSLGVNVESLRIRSMGVASFVTALIVSFVGIISFIGLVAPHLVRMVIGGDERYLLPGSALVGGTLLLVADMLARTVIAPIVLPVGILTSFVGAPLFLYLVITGREYW